MKKQQKNKKGYEKHKTHTSDKNILRGTITLSQKHIGMVVDTTIKRKVLIYPEDLRGALHGDTVTVRIYKNKSVGLYQGEVTTIHSRGKRGYIGTLEYKNTQYEIQPKDSRLYIPLILDKKPQTDMLGKTVYVSDLEFKKDKIIAHTYEYIGENGLHETEIESIIREQGFASKFPPEVEREANIYKEPSGKDFENRRDMRTVLTMTIDPFDAKDFDDALSIKKLPDDIWEIGIHIADVSHYVKPNTELDREAYKRATSIYLVDRTIPMLPEKLSNDICSLKPNVDRLTMSVIVTMNQNGDILSRWFGKTIIHSDRRFTYEDAGKSINNKDLPYHTELTVLNTIAKKLRHERESNGSLEFASEEIKCILNKDNTVKEFIRKERNDAHKLIEEYMLLANREVATLWNPKRVKKGHEQFLFRTHDIPNAEKLVLIESIAHALGYEISKTKNKITQRDIQKFLRKIQGTPHEGFLSTLMIRAMAKAIYSTKATGHFGLALSDYSHFTSPIRRYPDVIVHRFLQEYLQNKSKQLKPKILEQIALHTSMMEKNASEAERNSIAYKQIEYMLAHKGEVFTGKVTGVLPRGIFVSDAYSGSEGFIVIDNLLSGTWEFNEEHYTMTDTKNKRIIRLGDMISFSVVDGDALGRKLDYKEEMPKHV